MQPGDSLKMQEFAREDFPEYRNWFADSLLNAQLGPMGDDEWLEFVLSGPDNFSTRKFSEDCQTDQDQ